MKTAHGSASITALLIGMVISLIVLSSILITTVNHREGYRRLQSGLGELKAKQNFLSGFFHQQLSQSGYRNLPINNVMPSILASFPSGYLSGTEGTNDSLTYRFVGDGSYLRDCLGNLVALDSTSTNILTISNNTLLCNGQTLLNNVENMQVLYGEDTDSDFIPNRYVTANQSGLDFNQVVALRLGFVIAGSEITRDSSSNQSIQILGTTITGSDQKLRQGFVLTLPLRSLQP